MIRYEIMKDHQFWGKLQNRAFLAIVRITGTYDWGVLDLAKLTSTRVLSEPGVGEKTFSEIARFADMCGTPINDDRPPKKVWSGMWRPLDSAPRDGTAFVAWSGGPVLGTWDADRNEFRFHDTGLYEISGDEVECWLPVDGPVRR